MTAPIAKKIPYSFDIHNTEVSDEYFWLRDPKWPEVKNEQILNYLVEENNYANNFFDKLDTQKKQIFAELKGRIKLKDQSTYTKKNQYYYYTRTEEDQEYPIHCRKLGNSGKEEILLDVNKIAEGKDFTKIGAISISPSQQRLAYSIDHLGNETYTIKVLDLNTQQYLNDEIKMTLGNIVWHENGTGFFYTPTDENWQQEKVMYHKINDDQNEDALVFHEPDNLFRVNIDKSSSREYLMISVSGHEESECYVLSIKENFNSSVKPKLIAKKLPNIFYSLDHSGDYFYLHSNLHAKNFHIQRTSSNNIILGNDLPMFEDFIEEDKSRYLNSFDITKDYIILNYKDYGLPVIKIMHLESKAQNLINFPDSAFTASAYSTNYEENDLRINYSSLARPNTTYTYDFSNNKLDILKVEEIPSGLNSEDYQVERIFADSENVKVPITILYKKSLFKKDGSNPLYLYGYGSYGYGMPTSFRNSAISLVNKGFVFAIAHIRGGDELGQEWYESAKFLNKKRTFEDFLRAAEKLIEDKYTSRGNIVICGGSAGGLLIGYAINNKPELFKAAIAHVPFVDAVGSMLDETLPLTKGEFKEWGNPKEEEYFHYMSSYSPYDNVTPQNYPALFVTTGLSDPRVGYWEGAKWIAKLRANKTDDNVILLKTNMSAGHAGASGRFDYLKEVADDLAFIYKIFDIKN